jgi:acyl-CoA thioesterase-1
VKFAIVLSAVLLAANLCAAETGKNVVVLGDSIAAGLGVEAEEAYPAVLQEKIDKAGLHYKVINAGVSGDTSAGGLRRIDWVLRQKIDVLVLELGGNDGLRGISPEETSKNLQGIIDKVRAKYPQAGILITGMQMPGSMGEDYAKRFRAVFAEIAQKNKTAFVPFLLEGVGGKPELNQPDRIHPTAEGHRIVAENVWKFLKPMLQKSQSQPAQAAR